MNFNGFPNQTSLNQQPESPRLQPHLPDLPTPTRAARKTQREKPEEEREKQTWQPTESVHSELQQAYTRDGLLVPMRPAETETHINTTYNTNMHRRPPNPHGVPQHLLRSSPAFKTSEQEVWSCPDTDEAKRQAKQQTWCRKKRLVTGKCSLPFPF